MKEKPPVPPPSAPPLEPGKDQGTDVPGPATSNGWAAEAVGELAGTIAREIGSPLTAIEVAVDRLRRQKADPSHEEPALELQVILEQSHRLAGLARTLLSLARPVEGRRRPFHLDRVVEEMVKSRRSELKRSAIQVHLHHDQSELEVEADPHQVREALGALLGNARIALEGWEGPRSIRIQTGMVDQDRPFVRIQDSGPGVPVGQEEQIFLPFVSGWGREGIGLALCRIALLGQGGEIFLENPSEGRVGATFILLLGPSSPNPDR